jgi:hypothetical protein
VCRLFLHDMRNGEIVVTDIKKVNPEDEEMDELHKDA